jgi:hypothetical protein
MDGDPSQEDRIRLIGRLFFLLGGRKLNLRSPFCILSVQVVTKPVADLNVFMGKQWANMGSFMGRYQPQITLGSCLYVS